MPFGAHGRRAGASAPSVSRKLPGVSAITVSGASLGGDWKNMIEAPGAWGCRGWGDCRPIRNPGADANGASRPRELRSPVRSAARTACPRRQHACATRLSYRHHPRRTVRRPRHDVRSPELSTTAPVDRAFCLRRAAGARQAGCDHRRQPHRSGCRGPSTWRAARSHVRPGPRRTAEALARAPAGAPRQVNYAVFAADLGVRDGAFDVVIVPDLSAFADPADVLRRVRRLCAPGGVAVLVAPNTRLASRWFLDPPSSETNRVGPGYYELFDLVSLQFAKVRMIGQAPFVGYTVAELGASDEPDVSVDTSLLAASEEPEQFIAIASDRTIVLEPYSVVELPWQAVAASLAPLSRGPSDPVGLEAALKTSEQRVAELAALLDQARSTPATQPALTDTQQLEARLKDAEARAGDNHVRSERLMQQLHDLEEELRKQRDRGTRLSKQVDDERRARTKG